jgi:hypothetical protein
MAGLFDFDSGFSGGGSGFFNDEYRQWQDKRDREMFERMERREQQQAAEARAANELVRAERRRAGDEAFAYQSKADDRDYGLKKETLKLKRQELLEIGIPAAKVDKWYKEAQIQLARETLIEDRRQFDLQFGEGQRQFNASTGLDLLKTGASLSGPENYFEAADFARGVSQRGDVPKFLEDLRSTGAAGLATGPYSQSPTPLTLGSLQAKLLGTGGNGSMGPGAGGAAAPGGTGEADRALAAVTQIGMRPNKLQPMAIETLQPGEQKALASGLGKAGFYTPDWLAQYRQGQLGFGDLGAA